MKMPPEEKKGNRKIIATIVLFVALLALGVGLAVGFHRQLDQFRSAMSVRKSAKTPLLIMHYYGDYGFDEFLREGLASDASTALSSENRFEWACTCFAALGNENDSMLGRNYDYTQVRPLILFTDPPNGYASVSMVDITFMGIFTGDLSLQNRFRLLLAPYYPFDGMNEYGLAMGMMAIPQADGGKDPGKVTIGSLQVVRLVLDHARNVEEAIALLQNYNVDFSGGPPIHYLIADATGNSVVVEYLNGKPVVIQNSGPWQVATNFILSGRSLEVAESTCSRYKTAYETLREANGVLTPAESLLLLNQVSQRHTSWSIVYGLTSGEVRLTMNRNYKQVLDFNLDMKMNR